MKHRIFFIATIIFLTIVGITAYNLLFMVPVQEKFTTAKALYKDISQTVEATGRLEAQDTIKVGSIVPGIIEKLYFEENELVKEGQILALIDDGKADAEVRMAQGDMEEAQALLTYKELHYKRQESLYNAQQISQDRFDQLTSDLNAARANLFAKKAKYDLAQLTFDNKRIKAPSDGIVIAKNGSERETVTLASPPTIIYTIAKDVTQMEATILVDENNIALLKVGIEAELVYDAYPYKKFTGTISSLSNQPIIKETSISYEVVVKQDNSDMLLRPGMTVNARFIIQEKKNILTVPSYLFTINKTEIQKIASNNRYDFKPLDPQELRKLERERPIKTVWVVENKSFVEKAVEIGITDNIFFEITTGITDASDIVVSIDNDDIMQSFYKKMFNTGL